MGFQGFVGFSRLRGCLTYRTVSPQSLCRDDVVAHHQGSRAWCWDATCETFVPDRRGSAAFVLPVQAIALGEPLDRGRQRRRSRVGAVFASVIHCVLSRWWLGARALKALGAVLFLARAALSAAGTVMVRRAGFACWRRRGRGLGR